jgi:hypothetical protein
VYKIKQQNMNIKISLKKGFLLALVLLAHNNIFSQEKNKEE